ncbi:MAG: family 20 glycosylhydrolase [Spirochaetia bacterium]|nr:family 20 glycosylhydrolase [Spirochaetia bacterium]
MFGKMILLIVGTALLIGCPEKPVSGNGSGNGNSSQQEINPDSVSVENVPKDTLFAGIEIQLELQFLPETTTNRQINWTVTPPEVACVKEGNLLVAMREGTAKVKGVTANGKTVEFSVTVTGVSAPDSVTVDGTLYRRVMTENFVSPMLIGQMQGNKHKIEDGCLKIDADLGEPRNGNKQTLTVLNEYECDLIRVRLKLNDHNPNFRVQTTGADILYLYENETDLQFKSELYRIGDESNGQKLHYLNDYTRAEDAGKFVDFDIIRKENVILVYVDGKRQTSFDPEAFFTNPEFFTGITEFEFGVYWGERTQSVNGAEIEYIGLYTSGEIVKNSEPSVIPEPKMFTGAEGAFVINSLTEINDESGLAATAVDLFRSRISSSSGITLPAGNADSNVIRLIRDPGIANSEGYRLDVNTNVITIKANGYGGFLYGLYTLLQLMPPEVLSLSSVEGLTLTIPCCTIEDEPRFEWRGYMLDVSRQFFDAEFVKQLIDELSLIKINRFHWHLTDDGGVRFPFKGKAVTKAGNTYDFDRFMKKAAWRTGPNRDSANYNHTDYEQEGEWEFFDPNDSSDPNYPYRENAHGGFYTESEIRDVIRYARDRNITVIPEMDLPGHSKAVYELMTGESPSGQSVNLRCDDFYKGQNRCPKNLLPGSDTDLCVSNPDTVDVLTEMIRQMKAVFGQQYFHIGADEVKINPYSWYPIGHWWFCQRCEKKMREIVGNPAAQPSYENFQKLQAWFLEQIQPVARENGTKMVMWNEATKGNFRPQSDGIIHAWEVGNADMQLINSLGLKVINSDTNKYYLDYYQSEYDKNTYSPTSTVGHKSVQTLQTVYNYNVRHAGVEIAEGAQIGIQANYWTEKTFGFEKNGKVYTPREHVVYMSFPRIAAVAERAWSPEEKKDYANFYRKMQVQFKRFDASGLKGVCTDERIAK